MQTEAGQNRQSVIVGLGLTGLSCANYLARRQLPFTVVDSRDTPPGLQQLQKAHPQARVELGEFREQTFTQADQLIVSPGIDLRIRPIRQARERGVKITGDIDLFAREVRAPVVAVTGSNAKSTVVTLVAEMGRRAGRQVGLGGNIGTPALDLLEQESQDLYILELSSFQLETTSNLGAEVAAVLNISPDHQDRYDSMLAYHRAKHRIFQGARQAVVNRDDPLSEPLLPPHVRRWRFGLAQPDLNEFGVARQGEEDWLMFDQQALLPCSEIKLAGRHNISNALAALALGHAVGMPFEPMLEALREFPGLPHRCQWVGELRGAQFYNDSKGTNVGASLAAIEGLADKGRIILLAGGVGKGADFSPLAPALRLHGKQAILFGEAAADLEQALTGSVPLRQAADLGQAVQLAAEQAGPGDVVLLSPACASFDMFRNYEARGETFMQHVRELSQ